MATLMTIPQPPSSASPAVVIHCPRPACTFVASARRESGAIHALATHLIQVHLHRWPLCDVSGVPMCSGD